MTTPDHAAYATGLLSRAIVNRAIDNAKQRDPKTYKALLEHAPHYPIYDLHRVPDGIATAWNVAIRVAIDDVVHRDLLPKVLPKATLPTDTGNQNPAQAPDAAITDKPKRSFLNKPKTTKSEADKAERNEHKSVADV